MAGETPVSGVNAYGLDPESREMVIDMVRKLPERLLTKEKIFEFDRNEIFPEDVIREMLGPDIGLQLLFIPEEYGGMGGGARDCCVVTREMSKICLGIGTGFFAIQLGTDPIIVGGTDDQKEKWLSAIAEGKFLVAYGVTEPGAGSNVAAISTKAVPVKNDSGEITGYTISGSKQFISNGGYADIITVLAKTPEGPTFFVVEKGMEGFESGKAEEKHGIRASNTSPLTLSDVFVPIDNLIGKIPGQGLKQANQVFGYTRLMVASMALGAGEAALDIAIRYAGERIQFGGPLCEKQGYTHKLIVPHVVRLEAASAYIEEIALRLDRGEKDLQVEGSIAKFFATEAANKAADDCIQALGGYGYITEFGVEKIKRDVKITCIYEGTSEIQQNIISTFRWKKTRKSKGAFYREIQSEMETLAKDLSAGCEYFAIAANAVNLAVNLIHENNLVKKQFLMFRLAEMITHVEVGASLVRKAAALKQAGDGEADRTETICRVFAAMTAQTIDSGIRDILFGSGVFSEEKISGYLKEAGLEVLSKSRMNLVENMDDISNAIFNE